MKIHFGMVLAGAAIGAAGYWYYSRKTQIPNAYALGQSNPTVAYKDLTAAQLAQLNQSPPLPSPPSATQALQSLGSAASSVASSVGTGALLGVDTHRLVRAGLR